MKALLSRFRSPVILGVVCPLLILIALAGFSLLNFRSYRIPSNAMIPTLKPGDRIQVRIRNFGEIRRGDIVVFPAPKNARIKETLVKRVIGLPGETLSLRAGAVVVNGRALSEPYLKEPNSTEAANAAFDVNGRLKFPYKVPPDSYIVLGDNRDDSFDSRYWGPVRGQSITGKVVRIVPAR